MPLLGVIPCKYPDKLYLPETRAIVLPDTENCTVISSFIWTKHQNVTDGQTGRQTDRYAISISAIGIASNADAL